MDTSELSDDFQIVEDLSFGDDQEDIIEQQPTNIISKELLKFQEQLQFVYHYKLHH